MTQPRVGLIEGGPIGYGACKIEILRAVAENSPRDREPHLGLLNGRHQIGFDPLYKVIATICRDVHLPKEQELGLSVSLSLGRKLRKGRRKEGTALPQGGDQPANNTRHFLRLHRWRRRIVLFGQFLMVSDNVIYALIAFDDLRDFDRR